LAEKLKREFIELLEKDVEFRYTVAGYIGLSDILKRLDRLEEAQRSLLEGQQKLWEGQNKLWNEVRALREGQNKLWDAHNKLWEEVRNLREGQDRLRKYMVSGFRGLSRALGVTFEDHAASFLEVMLVEMGYPDARVEKKYLVYGGEVLELNLFCEEPLVVGEATVSVEDAEVEKVLKRARAVEERYGRKPTLTLLCAATCRADLAERLKELCEKHGIKLILGKEIAEALTP
jgi:hypothetical protein